jgi:hypothetical protein
MAVKQFLLFLVFELNLKLLLLQPQLPGFNALQSLLVVGLRVIKSFSLPGLEFGLLSILLRLLGGFMMELLHLLLPFLLEV